MNRLWFLMNSTAKIQVWHQKHATAQQSATQQYNKPFIHDVTNYLGPITMDFPSTAFT